MNKKLNLIFSIVFISGCTGMNTEFENTKPAKDSGYWLQQADEMTNDSSLGNNFKDTSYNKINVLNYKLIDTGNLRLPIKAVQKDFVNFNKTNFINNDHQINFKSIENTENMSCSNVSNCYKEPNSPYRESDNISRLWLAPYVSPDDNVHLGELVYFVTKKSKWNGIEKDGK